MRKAFLTILLMSLSIMLSANGNTETERIRSIPAREQSDSEITLVYAEINPLESIAGRTGLYFKNQVERLTNGSVKIDIRHSGELGNETDYLDAIIGGSEDIDMARVSASSITSYGGQYSIFLSLPFMFESREHFWNFANSPLTTEFLNEPLLMGLPIRGIFYGEEGFRHFFSSSELDDITDLEGMRIRVSNDPLSTGLVNSLHADPVVMPFEDVKEAIESGKISGAEQPIANYRSNDFYKVAPNLILDGHTLGIMEVIISSNAWNALNDEQKQAIMEAGHLAQEFNAQISSTAEDQMIEDLEGKGIRIIQVEDKTPWIEAVASLTEKYMTNRRPLYEMIKSLRPQN